MNENPTADWQLMNNLYYCKQDVYRLEWRGVKLSDHLVAAAPCGGFVAMTRNDKKLVAVAKRSLKPSIDIFSSSGRQLASFTWEHEGIVKLGWNKAEDLVVVTEYGNIFVYSVFGDLRTQFSMGQDCEEYGVIDARIFHSGVVVLSGQGQFQFYVVTDFGVPRVSMLADGELSSAPTAWDIVLPFEGPINATIVEAIVCTLEGSLISLSVSQAFLPEPDVFPPGPFVHMAVSPSQQFITLVNEDMDVIVISANLQKILSQYRLDSVDPPSDVAWVGSDAVAVTCGEDLYIIGPFAEPLMYTYDEEVVVFSEIDGAWIFSAHHCEFIHKVPEELVTVFQVGSTAPAALLYDAALAFQAKSPRADEGVREIRERLGEAVDVCIRAAALQPKAILQQLLLKAASFGKSFLELHNPSFFVNTSMQLRVMNAVRHYEVGIPVTYPQYLHLGTEALLRRLLVARHHLLALRLCAYLGLAPSTVIVDWASQKVAHSYESDLELYQQIMGKLKGMTGVPYAEIAETAFRANRVELATKLLDHEPRVAAQVPLLLRLGQIETALMKAVESGDTDQVYLVVMRVEPEEEELQGQTRVQSSELFKLIRKYPTAICLVLAYYRFKNPEFVKDFYYQADLPEMGALVMIQEACRDPMGLGGDPALTNLRKAAMLFQNNKKTAFEHKALEEQLKLLTLQTELQTTFGEAYIGLPLSETLFKLLARGDARRAARLKSDFKIPDKRFWWIKLNALGVTHDWDGMEKFAREKKSPIGYMPFVETCGKYGASKNVVMRFISRLSDVPSKVQAYCDVGAHREAAEVAFAAKNTDLLVAVRESADRDTQYAVDQMLASLQK